QGAHRSQRREFILPSRFALVKHFFQVFQNFFQRFSRGNRPAHSPAALADDLTILPPLPHFFKHFFQIFFDLFSRLTRFRREFSLPSRFALIKLVFLVFQSFFQRFSRGNCPALPPAALADVLFILPPLPHFVMHFFQIFFDLFSRLTRFRREFSTALADSLRR